MDLVIFDMASLSVEVDASRRVVTLLSAGGEVLCTVAADDLAPGLFAAAGADPADPHRRELVFTLLDGALRDGWVSRIDRAGRRRRGRVALYNPYTAEVAVGSVPATRAFSRRASLPVPPAGVPASLAEDRVRLSGGVELVEVSRTFAQLSRVFAAHRG